MKDCLIPLRSPLAHNGHVTFKINGRAFAGHRLLAAMFYDLNPNGAWQAVHTCGNKACVNPAHLKIEPSLTSNMRKNTPQKLTEEQVEAIYNDYRPAKIIAYEYDITAHSVHAIRNGRRQHGVTGAVPIRVRRAMDAQATHRS